MRIWLRFFYLLCALLLTAKSAQANTVYPISPFSERYHATVTVTDKVDDVFKPGFVSVYDSQTKKRILKVSSEELAFEVKNGQTAANIKELPYGEQSVLIYEDFNFDGKKDLALMDGQNSCYHGPSFQIFVAAGYGFKPDAALTELAQVNCGMFDVGDKSKQIHTMTKSGCCWHQFDTYQYEGTRLKLIESIEESFADSSSMYMQTKTTTWANKRKQTKTEFDLNTDDENKDNVVLSFNLQNQPNKTVWILNDGGIVDYALTQGEGNAIEYSQRLDGANLLSSSKRAFKAKMVYEPKNARLSFKTLDASFKVFTSPEHLGIEVTENGKTSFIAGNPATLKGSLNKLEALAAELETNLCINTCAAR